MNTVIMNMNDEITFHDDKLNLYNSFITFIIYVFFLFSLNYYLLIIKRFGGPDNLLHAVALNGKIWLKWPNMEAS